MIQIKLIEKNKGQICNSILRSLPNWFGIETAIQQYVEDVESMPMFVAHEGDQVLGFLSLNLHNEYTAEIHVMGVLEEFHGKKIGRSLVRAAEEFLIERKYKLLSVKTLSKSRKDEYYDRTRKFYLSEGFIPVEEFKTLWGEHNPCLFLVKVIG